MSDWDQRTGRDPLVRRGDGKRTVGTLTRRGRVVYQRKRHPFTIRDVHRVATGWTAANPPAALVEEAAETLGQGGLTKFVGTLRWVASTVIHLYVYLGRVAAAATLGPLATAVDGVMAFIAEQTSSVRSNTPNGREDDSGDDDQQDASG